MQSFTKTFSAWAALCAVSITGAAPLTSQVSQSPAPVAKVRVSQTFTAASAVAAPKPATRRA